MFRNLTEYEIDTLPQTYNLTDGDDSRRGQYHFFQGG
jgi:hypothetical protein